MTIAWTLTRDQIADKALRKLNVVGVGQTAKPEDTSLAIDALDAILKELPIHGYSWPKTVSGQASLTLVAATQVTNLPSDYYGNPILTFIDAAGNENKLEIITLDQWNAIPNKSQAAAYPQVAYIDNFNVLRTWPVQSANVTAKLVYQKVIDDTAVNTATNLDSYWMRGIVSGVAGEIGEEFEVEPQKLLRLQQKWVECRTLSIMHRTYPSPDRMTVAD